MYAPQISNHIHWLSQNSYMQGNNYPYDATSVQNILDIFDLLQKIKQTREDVWELWLTAERGPEEAFGNFNEMLQCGDVDSREEFEEWWKGEFPEETMWYEFVAVERKDINYKAIMLSNKMIIEIDPRKSGGFEQNISEFTEWLLQQVKLTICELENDTYNQKVATELPVQYRTGTIVRKDLHDMCPDLRTYFHSNLNQEEIDTFVGYIENQPSDMCDIECLQHLTAGEFYNLCSLGYRANDYEGCDLSPKEQYYLHADGRDEDLASLPLDSEEAFISWLHDKKRIGGHPWEVCRGGNSTHISLFVSHNESGFRLSLEGKAITRCIETIKFYLALRKYGVPVYLHYGEQLKERVLEKELVGFVPFTVFPRYCESRFPRLNVIDFMHIPWEDRIAIAEKVIWLPEPKITLADDS